MDIQSHRLRKFDVQSIPFNEYIFSLVIVHTYTVQQEV